MHTISVETVESQLRMLQYVCNCAFDDVYMGCVGPFLGGINGDCLCGMGLQLISSILVAFIATSLTS